MKTLGTTTATATSLLKNGTPVALRPVGPDDKPLLEEGMARLSSNSRRLRFMAPVDRLSRAQLRYLTEIDHVSHVAWGALIGGQPVAVGRFVRLDQEPTAAELAVTVVDAWQRRGLGSLLVRLMAELGRTVGIERFTFDALPENQGITCLLAGFGAEQRLVEGVISGSLDLAGISPPELVDGNIKDLALAARRPVG